MNYLYKEKRKKRKINNNNNINDIINPLTLTVLLCL